MNFAKKIAFRVCGKPSTLMWESRLKYMPLGNSTGNSSSSHLSNKNETGCLFLLVLFPVEHNYNICIPRSGLLYFY